MNTLIKHNAAIKYYKLAKMIANLFSKDESTKVGSLFIAPYTHEILSTGYNGMPRGINDNDATKWERPIKYEYVEHAERNAIYNAARQGSSLVGSICLVTMFPCADCARGIIQTGTKLVVTNDPFKTNSPDLIERWKDKWNISIDMFKEAGVEIAYLEKEEVKFTEQEFLELIK